MLDPRRIGLNAADIGFQKRMRQELDYNAFERALQTDYNNQGSAIQVRRERDAAKDEIHVMGGERAGFQSNDLIKTLARQQRQINGYPLRQFDAQNPAVILPQKYGGFPLYNRNQVEYPEYVSVFTEPMSAPLQRDTELLGRSGAVALSHSLTRPFEPDGYINPMTRTYDQLQANQSEFVQRKHLRNMSDRSRIQKWNLPSGDKGIFINPNGDPMSTVQEQLTGAIATNNTFAAAQTNQLTRQARYMNFNLPLNSGPGELYQDGGPSGMAMLTSGPLAAKSERLGYDTPTVSRDKETALQSVENDIVFLDYPSLFAQQQEQNVYNRVAITNQETAYNPLRTGPANGMQSLALLSPSTTRGGAKYGVNRSIASPVNKYGL